MLIYGSKLLDFDFTKVANILLYFHILWLIFFHNTILFSNYCVREKYIRVLCYL